MTKQQYIVVGGIYADTEFNHIDMISSEEYGPFETYDDAYEIWETLSWATVDDCLARYTIISKL